MSFVSNQIYSSVPYSGTTVYDFLLARGVHKKSSPVVGVRRHELKLIKKSPEFNNILVKLEAAIYNDIHLRYVIPLDKKHLADIYSRELFLEYIEKYSKYGFYEFNIVDWTYSSHVDLITNKVSARDADKYGNPAFIHAMVEGAHGNFNEMFNRYAPPHIVAYHELMHVEEKSVKDGGLFESSLGTELLTTIKTIILNDTVYKKIHDISIDVEVDYAKVIDFEGHKIPLGAFTNFYRQCEQKYTNLATALVSDESISYLKNFMTKKVSDCKTQVTLGDFSINLSTPLLSCSKEKISRQSECKINHNGNSLEVDEPHKIILPTGIKIPSISAIRAGYEDYLRSSQAFERPSRPGHSRGEFKDRRRDHT